ncbi:MAG: hypothetical protein M0Q13_09830 [Methanothrix sp.]|nr:hypothetical protein [Methanothrix sp.]
MFSALSSPEKSPSPFINPPAITTSTNVDININVPILHISLQMFVFRSSSLCRSDGLESMTPLTIFDNRVTGSAVCLGIASTGRVL